MNKFDKAYIQMAQIWSQLSSAKRRQVGCLIVKDKTIIADGYNGTISGMDNCCEDENGLTHWYVLHAEANALTKLARSTQSSVGSTLYTTTSPCRCCAKLIVQSGIKRVVYQESYHDDLGVEFLKSQSVECEQMKLKEPIEEPH